VDYRKKVHYSWECTVLSVCLHLSVSLVMKANVLVNGCLYCLVTCLAQSFGEGAERGGGGDDGLSGCWKYRPFKSDHQTALHTSNAYFALLVKNKTVYRKAGPEGESALHVRGPAGGVQRGQDGNELGRGLPHLQVHRQERQRR
jgi:hypothetical protein